MENKSHYAVNMVCAAYSFIVVFIHVEKMASKTDRNEMFLRSHSMEQTPFSASKEISEFFGTQRLSFSSSPEPLFLCRAR